MLHKVGRGRHAVAALSVGVVTMLGGCGVLGAGDQSVLRGEHVDAKHVTVTPAEGETGLRIREVIDIDFAEPRRGVQRIIPNDFGVPTDIVATSPTADESLTVTPLGNETRLRVGDPAVTFTGQHRYVLEFTLPTAFGVDGAGQSLALDIIGNDETLRTDRFEVVVRGFDLRAPECAVGGFGTVGGCDLERRPSPSGVPEFGVVFEPLEPGEGITIGGLVESMQPAGFVDVAPVDPDPSGFRPLGALLGAVGAAVAAAVFAINRRLGSNEVRGAGGAADAAFGDLPTPGDGDPVGDVATYRVPDSRLAELATIEFVPPRGVEPWQGAAVLRERVDDDTVMAWFSEMIAREAIEIDESNGDATLRRGRHPARLHAIDQRHLDDLFAAGDVELGAYDERFTDVWNAIRREQQRFVADSGWWSRGVHSGGSVDVGAALASLARWGVVLVIFLLAAITAGSFLAASLGSAVFAVVVTVVGVGIVAGGAYRSMLPARTATGSALALRTESFRRFLAASEGRHVDWAWERNVLREYSAWAVALGAADAWRDAVEASNVPHPEVALRGPLLIPITTRSFDSARTKPSSSGGGGAGFGGGFSGGSVGGGGGGGSSGSW